MSEVAQYGHSSDPPKWGVSQTIALALAALDLDVVHRSTLRAMLPTGATPLRKVRLGRVRGASTGRTPGLLGPKRKNNMSDKFQRALSLFEGSGWVVRGEQYVLIRNRRALLNWAAASDPPDWLVLPLSSAIEAINRELTEDPEMNAKAVEQRRRELLALQRLMEEGFGSANWSGRSSVRFFPRSKTL
jgi:hypothetical protein